MHKRQRLLSTIATFLFLGLQPSFAASTTITMNLVSEKGQGKEIGTIIATQQKCGVLLTPNLHNLPPGTHGFHVHVKPSCADKGMAAGDHFDPTNKKMHHGPYNDNGHLGDLPVLIVAQDGTATLPTLAPRFTLSKLKGHALIIHAGSDNYADQPEKLGGGGARLACGTIQ